MQKQQQQLLSSTQRQPKFSQIQTSRSTTNSRQTRQAQKSQTKTVTQRQIQKSGAIQGNLQNLESLKSQQQNQILSDHFQDLPQNLAKNVKESQLFSSFTMQDDRNETFTKSAQKVNKHSNRGMNSRQSYSKTPGASHLNNSGFSRSSPNQIENQSSENNELAARQALHLQLEKMRAKNSQTQQKQAVDHQQMNSIFSHQMPSSSNQNTVKHQKSASSRVFVSNQPENAPPQVLNNTAGGARGKQILGIPDVLIDRKQLQKKNQRSGNRSALGFNHNNSSQLNYSSIQDKIFTSMTGTAVAPIKEKAKKEKTSRSIKDSDIDSNQNLKLMGLRSGHEISSEERFFEGSGNNNEQDQQLFGKMVRQYQILNQIQGENVSQNVDDDYKYSSMNKMQNTTSAKFKQLIRNDQKKSFREIQRPKTSLEAQNMSSGDSQYHKTVSQLKDKNTPRGSQSPDPRAELVLSKTQVNRVNKQIRQNSSRSQPRGAISIAFAPSITAPLHAHATQSIEEPRRVNSKLHNQSQISQVQKLNELSMRSQPNSSSVQQPFKLKYTQILRATNPEQNEMKILHQQSSNGSQQQHQNTHHHSQQVKKILKSQRILNNQSKSTQNAKSISTNSGRHSFIHLEAKSNAVQGQQISQVKGGNSTSNMNRPNTSTNDNLNTRILQAFKSEQTVVTQAGMQRQSQQLPSKLQNWVYSADRSQEDPFFNQKTPGGATTSSHSMTSQRALYKQVNLGQQRGSSALKGQKLMQDLFTRQSSVQSGNHNTAMLKYKSSSETPNLDKHKFNNANKSNVVLFPGGKSSRQNHTSNQSKNRMSATKSSRIPQNSFGTSAGNQAAISSRTNHAQSSSGQILSNLIFPQHEIFSQEIYQTPSDNHHFQADLTNILPQTHKRNPSKSTHIRSMHATNQKDSGFSLSQPKNLKVSRQNSTSTRSREEMKSLSKDVKILAPQADILGSTIDEHSAYMNNAEDYRKKTKKLIQLSKTSIQPSNKTAQNKASNKDNGGKSAQNRQLSQSSQLKQRVGLSSRHLKTKTLKNMDPSIILHSSTLEAQSTGIAPLTSNSQNQSASVISGYKAARNQVQDTKSLVMSRSRLRQFVNDSHSMKNPQQELDAIEFENQSRDLGQIQNLMDSLSQSDHQAKKGFSSVQALNGKSNHRQNMSKQILQQNATIQAQNPTNHTKSASTHQIGQAIKQMSTLPITKMQKTENTQKVSSKSVTKKELQSVLSLKQHKQMQHLIQLGSVQLQQPNNDHFMKDRGQSGTLEPDLSLFTDYERDNNTLQNEAGLIEDQIFQRANIPTKSPVPTQKVNQHDICPTNSQVKIREIQENHAIQPYQSAFEAFLDAESNIYPISVQNSEGPQVKNMRQSMLNCFSENVTDTKSNNSFPQKAFENLTASILSQNMALNNNHTSRLVNDFRESDLISKTPKIQRPTLSMKYPCNLLETQLCKLSKSQLIEPILMKSTQSSSSGSQQKETFTHKVTFEAHKNTIKGIQLLAKPGNFASLAADNSVKIWSVAITRPKQYISTNRVASQNLIPSVTQKFQINNQGRPSHKLSSFCVLSPGFSFEQASEDNQSTLKSSSLNHPMSNQIIATGSTDKVLRFHQISDQQPETVSSQDLSTKRSQKTNHNRSAEPSMKVVGQHGGVISCIAQMGPQKLSSDASSTNYGSSTDQTYSGRARPILTGCMDTKVRLFSLDALSQGHYEEPISTFSQGNTGVSHLCPLSENTFLSGGFDGSVRLWDIRRQESLTLFKEISYGKVTQIRKFSPEIFAVASDNGCVNFWEIRTCRLINQIRIQKGKGSISDFTFAHRRQFMIMAYDTSVSVVNLFDSKQVSVLDTTKHLGNQAQQITSLAYSEPEKRIYTGSSNCSISMWSWNNNNQSQLN